MQVIDSARSIKKSVSKKPTPIFEGITPTIEESAIIPTKKIQHSHVNTIQSRALDSDVKRRKRTNRKKKQNKKNKEKKLRQKQKQQFTQLN